MDKVIRTDAEWRELLTPEEYAVLRRAGPALVHQLGLADPGARGLVSGAS